MTATLHHQHAVCDNTDSIIHHQHPVAIRRRTEVDAIAATILVNVLVCRPVVYIIIMIPKIPMSDEAAGALGTQYCVVG